MRHAVSEVRASGYTSRDAGLLLGLSNQRISQIERQSPGNKTDRK
jgi:DNA-binding XRE family transcriptional regulator